MAVDLPRIVSFDWPVPAGQPGHTCLLAIMTSADDPIATTELSVPALVPGNKKCGLKNLTIVDPPPAVGPRIAAILLYLWRQKNVGVYELAVNGQIGSIVAAAVLSRRMAALAKKQGALVVKLTAAQKAEVDKLVRLRPALAKTLETRFAYRPPKGSTWLRSLTIDPKTPQPMILLVSEKARRGTCSIVQKAENGAVLGGFTIQALGRK